jgi:WD domain, G-beta repeat
LWNLTTTPAQLDRTLAGHTAPVLSLAFNPKRKTFASGGADNMVTLWDTNTWTPFPPLTGHGGPVQSVTFSRDGKMLASGSSDSKIVLWSVSTLSTPNSGMSQASILWNVNMPEPPDRPGVSQSRLSTNSGVTSLAFSPDNKFLASVSPELGIVLWGVHKGKPFALPLRSFGSNLLGIAFSPDGKKLLSGSANDTAIPWDMRPEYWKEQACKIATRNLTSREWEDHLEQDIGWSFYHRGCPELPRQDGEPLHSMPRRFWGRVLEGWYGFLSLL